MRRIMIAILLVTALVATSKSYGYPDLRRVQTPMAPLSPRNQEQCRQLRQQWQQLCQKIGEVHNRCLSDMSGSGASGGGPNGCSYRACDPYHGTCGAFQEKREAQEKHCSESVRAYQEWLREKRAREERRRREFERERQAYMKAQQDVFDKARRQFNDWFDNYNRSQKEAAQKFRDAQRRSTAPIAAPDRSGGGSATRLFQSDKNSGFLAGLRSLLPSSELLSGNIRSILKSGLSRYEPALIQSVNKAESLKGHWNDFSTAAKFGTQIARGEQVDGLSLTSWVTNKLSNFAFRGSPAGFAFRSANSGLTRGAKSLLSGLNGAFAGFDSPYGLEPGYSRRVIVDYQRELVFGMCSWCETIHTWNREVNESWEQIQQWSSGSR